MNGQMSSGAILSRHHVQNKPMLEGLDVGRNHGNRPVLAKQRAVPNDPDGTRLARALRRSLESAAGLRDGSDHRTLSTQSAVQTSLVASQVHA